MRGDSLHKVWDSTLGRGRQYSDAMPRALQLLNNEKFTKLGESSARNFNTKSPDFEKWAGESLHLAKTFAYHENILKAAKETEDKSQKRLMRVDLPRHYYTQMGTAARERITQAGYRLAKVLERVE